MRTVRRGLAALAFASLLFGSARAEAPTAKRADPAVSFSAQARTAYVAGQFREAIALYQQAYRHKADPVILFNLARCHEALGGPPDLEAAVEAYEGYLRASGDAPDRAALERRIGSLRQEIEILRERTKPKGPAPPLSPTTEPVATLSSSSAGRCAKSGVSRRCTRSEFCR